MTSLAVADAALEAAGKAIEAARAAIGAAKAVKAPTSSTLRELPHNMTRRQAKELLSLETRVYDRVAREHGRRPGQQWIVPTVKLLEAIGTARTAPPAAPSAQADENAPLPFDHFAARLRKKAG